MIETDSSRARLEPKVLVDVVLTTASLANLLKWRILFPSIIMTHMRFLFAEEGTATAVIKSPRYVTQIHVYWGAFNLLLFFILNYSQGCC